MSDPQAVAQGFTDYYYRTFDQQRSNLRPLYREHSMLSFEGANFQGVDKIIEKIESLPFTRIEHRVLSVDAQPSNPTLGSLLVTVTGQLITDNEGQALFFCQTFQLIPENGSYWVFNDIFRLNYG